MAAYYGDQTALVEPPKSRNPNLSVWTITLELPVRPQKLSKATGIQ